MEGLNDRVEVILRVRKSWTIKEKILKMEIRKELLIM